MLKWYIFENNRDFSKMFTWMLVLVFLMAGGGRSSKRHRATTKKTVVEQPADEGSEYAPEDNDSEETEDDEVDWEALTPEVLTKKKGKEKAAEKTKGKGKATAAEKSKGKTTAADKEKGKAKVPEPPRRSLQDVPSGRFSMYSTKQCIGERHFGIASIMSFVHGFQQLFEKNDLAQICDFPEETGYGLELIREFYMRAGHLSESDGGPYQFITSVRGVELTITPDTIAMVLGMTASTAGVDYLQIGMTAPRDWKRIVDAICVPGAESDGYVIMSKDLKIEYRALNFIVCYNIMPLANTKVLRRDRVVYLYLLGQPEIAKARNLNMNIPYLIWRRMAKDIKTSGQNERLPFPLIIMRILRFCKVNTICTSYEHSLGAIHETTFIKSNVQLKTQSTQASHPASTSRPFSAPEAAGPSHPTEQTADEEVSLATLHREQQQLSADVQVIKKDVSKMKRMLRRIFSTLGCSSEEEISD